MLNKINCSLENYWSRNFSEYDLTDIKSCLINSSETLGKSALPQHGTVGFIVLILLLLVVIYLAIKNKKA